MSSPTEPRERYAEAFTAHRDADTLAWERTIVDRVDGDRIVGIAVVDDDLSQLDAFLASDRRG